MLDEQTPTTADDFGPHLYGVDLLIDPLTSVVDRSAPVAVDVETDEKDGFVGAAVCSGNLVGYYTTVADLRSSIEGVPLIGHNLKGDLHWLRKWGINVGESSLFYDTMIASYVVQPTRVSHGLKPLSAALLAMQWPSYATMVENADYIKRWSSENPARVPLTKGGKPRVIRRLTLDKQPVERVARYCGMDCLATYRLYQYFNRTMTPNQRRIFNRLEMPVNRVLYKMEATGVKIDVPLLGDLDVRFQATIADILETVHKLTAEDIQKLLVEHRVDQRKEKWEQTGFEGLKKTGRLNPGSWQQKRLLLKYLGLELDSTDKKELIRFKGNELIDVLLRHSEFSKLYSAFIKAFQALPTLPYINTTFSQVSEDKANEDDAHGIRTGRLSAKSPNLQQIPARTENGRLLRQLFIPREDHVYIVLDYSQIELRLAAHFSHDPILVSAFKNGEDVHDATARALGVDRFYGKTGNFLLAFGGSHWRLMSSLNIDEQKARRFFELYWQKFRVLKQWKDRAVERARVRGGVSTITGRWIPVEDLNSPNLKIRSRAERQAISCIIQGSAADVMKLALIECNKLGHTPVLTVHDELVFEVRESEVTHLDMMALKEIMENVVKLDVPLVAEGGIGKNWGEAKQ